MAKIIDGTEIAATITRKLKEQLDATPLKRKPCLAVVLVGTRKDSEVYVRMKRNAATQIGIQFLLVQLDDGPKTTDEVLIAKVKQLNDDDTVDGIIVQQPLPPHLNTTLVVDAVSPHKDVDGYHTMNMGRLFQPSVVSAAVFPQSGTARGILVLIDSTGIALRGKTVVLIGTGNVGKPLAMMLMQRDATVVCCNKYTANIEDLSQRGDIIVAAAGCANLVRGSWIKPGAIVIDVGINTIPDETRRSGYRIVGDVAYDEARKIASHITPVPGGVGPMTVAMLMSAVVETWQSK